MADLATLIENVAKMRHFVGVYLDLDNPSPKQKAALKVDLTQLDRNLAALAAYKAPVALVPPVPVVPVAAPVNPVPNFGESDAMSSGLYADWMAKWVVARFPDAYREWPPTVYSITPEALHAAAVEDGCLAQVTACGNFGTPEAPYPDLGDFSLYTALTSTSTDTGEWKHQVWHMGKLVAEKVGGPNDALEWAHSLGFNW